MRCAPLRRPLKKEYPRKKGGKKTVAKPKKRLVKLFDNGKQLVLSEQELIRGKGQGLGGKSSRYGSKKSLGTEPFSRKMFDGGGEWGNMLSCFLQCAKRRKKANCVMQRGRQTGGQKGGDGKEANSYRTTPPCKVQGGRFGFDWLEIVSAKIPTILLTDAGYIKTA